MSDLATIFLRLDAPVAAWRWLQAGVYRGTFPVIPPSAAWGLVLNLAGVETRGPLSEVVTPIRDDAPVLEIAVGLERPGQRSAVYQQLHSYPVGNSGTELRDRAKGNKFWIAPVHREILLGVVATVGARGPRALIDRVSRGLDSTLDVPRYGLPFAGDNQLLFSRIDASTTSPVARWFVPVVDLASARETTRLTTNIDRADASRTQAPLFEPTPEPAACPDQAWLRIGPAAARA
ncbi:MAG TPA: CRISPR-associated protein Cas5 [Kofleriaceae bacterium]|nr:CRISPR-associated protein Cas5 [Kofleriaceae bacterium]